MARQNKKCHQAESSRVSKCRNLGLCILGLASSTSGYEAGVRTRRLDDEGSPDSPYILKKKEIPEGRPTMYTYFEDTGSYAAVGAVELVSEWEASWNDAGWDTRILNFSHAESHPDFHMLEEVLEASGNSKISEYEKACFYRWFAIAAALPEGGGGWMSDFDTFPLNIQPIVGHEIPNDGEFTSHDGAVPDLLSGSKEEFDRMTHLLVENISNSCCNHVSDMNVIIYLKGTFGEDAAHFESERVASGWAVHVNGDLDCEKIAGDSLAVHFSHAALFGAGVENGWFKHVVGREPDEEDKSKMHAELAEARPKMGSKYIETWKAECNIVDDN